MLSTYLGLLTLGKSDFEAAEGVRKDPFFLSCMGLKRGLSAARLRQRMDASAMDYARALDRANLAFLQQAKVPVTPLSCGHLALDLDLFAQDNSGTHKEGVGNTYRGFDGYGVMPAYLGEEGWWTSLELSDDDIIALYRGHATCEQFHSEFKTDMDLERPPSGKFDTNALVMAAGTFVYNVLRWIGLQGLIGDDSPVRHPAKRRRIRTVFQELISLPAQLVHHARQVWLRFGAHCPGFAAFKRVFTQLQACASG